MWTLLVLGQLHWISYAWQIVPKCPAKKKGSPLSTKRIRETTKISKPAENTPTPNGKRKGGKQKKKKKQKTSFGAGLSNEGRNALLSHSVRDTIYDIRPTSNPDKQRIRPFVYWNPNKRSTCVKMLLKRSPS